MSAAAYDRPGYVVSALAERLARIHGVHLSRSAADIRDMLSQAKEEELVGLRAYVAGVSSPSHVFWTLEGHREITEAYRAEYALALFRVALEGCSYVRHGRDFCPDVLLVYGRDPASPSGVTHTGSHRATPEALALVAAARQSPLSPTEGLRK